MISPPEDSNGFPSSSVFAIPFKFEADVGLALANEKPGKLISMFLMQDLTLNLLGGGCVFSSDAVLTVSTASFPNVFPTAAKILWLPHLSVPRLLY